MDSVSQIISVERHIGRHSNFVFKMNEKKHVIVSYIVIRFYNLARPNFIDEKRNIYAQI